MLVLVGLGNPGAKYARHRHNVGFMAADAIAEAYGFGSARTKFQSEIREGFLCGPPDSDKSGRRKAIIVKPQTYMNESGRAVGDVMRFYKLDAHDIVVFYDELDLAAGKLRAKTGGGAAGHNGIRSIDAHIGNDFRRIRIGIGHPGDKSKVSNHVLSDFSKSDKSWLDPLLAAIAASAPSILMDEKRFASDVAAKLNVQPPRRTQKAPAEKNSAGEQQPGEKQPGEKQQRGSTADSDKSGDGPFAAVLHKLFGKSAKRE